MPESTNRVARVEFLDQFRGFTIVLMICVNTMSGFNVTPTWLKHATEFGHITITDFIITMFMFAVGMAMELTFPRSRARTGTLRTVWRYVRRNIVLIAFGLLGSIILRRNLLDEWGVLQTLGGASLIALPFMFVHPYCRLAVAIVLVAAYEMIGVSGYWTWLLSHDTGHFGGILAGLAWAGVILIASFIAWFVRNQDKIGFRRASVIIAVLGIGLTLALRNVLPIFRPLVTTTYLLVTMGFAAFVMFIFALLGLRFLPFRMLGRNALAVFMLHGILVVTAPRVFAPSSSLGIVLLTSAVTCTVCILFAAVLYSKRISIRL